MPLFEAHLQTLFAGTSSATGPGITFSNSNGVSFGISGNVITASIAGGGGGGIMEIAAPGTTATGPSVVFSNAHGVSFGAVGNTITASVGAAGDALTVTIFSQRAGFETNYRVSNGCISFQKVSMAAGLSGASGVWLMDLVAPASTSGAFSISFGAYSITGSTASAVVTTWGGFTWQSGSDTTASTLYGGVSGTRYRTFPWPVSLPPGDYVFAFAMSMPLGVSARVFGRQGVNIVGQFAGIETAYFLDGVSVSTAFVLPTLIIATDTGYVRTGLSAAQQPGVILVGTM